MINAICESICENQGSLNVMSFQGRPHKFATTVTLSVRHYCMCRYFLYDLNELNFFSFLSKCMSRSMAAKTLDLILNPELWFSQISAHRNSVSRILTVAHRNTRVLPHDYGRVAPNCLRHPEEGCDGPW